MAYAGDPIQVEELLFRLVHSLIDQSLHSRLGATTTNGDGFGIGWYGERPEPAAFKSVDPAHTARVIATLASAGTEIIASPTPLHGTRSTLD
jgi:predicted glutamine amidotransferase